MESKKSKPHNGSMDPKVTDVGQRCKSSSCVSTSEGTESEDNSSIASDDDENGSDSDSSSTKNETKTGKDLNDATRGGLYPTDLGMFQRRKTWSFFCLA